MAGSINKVILVGHLGRDPEVRFTQDNRKIVHLSIATSERWRDRNTGDQRERTEWHRVVIYNEQLADIAERYLNKGRLVYVEGQLQTRRWTDAGGQERWTTEVVISRFRGELAILDGRRGEAPSEPAEEVPADEPPAVSSRPAREGGRDAGRSYELDDEIPF
ncbi:Single-stranded DNA-binding protein [bacterium HR40]|nr:Single-stranded DNA-binding protein [bacterium HR40]